MQPNNRKHFLNYFYTIIGVGFLLLIVIFYLVSSNTPTQNLGLVSTVPSNGELDSPWSTEPVEFVFNSPVDVKTLSYTVIPATRTKVAEQQNLSTITIVPLEGWDDSVEYKIEIDDSLKSLRGEKLKENVSLVFKRTADYEKYTRESEGEDYSNLDF